MRELHNCVRQIVFWMVCNETRSDEPRQRGLASLGSSNYLVFGGLLRNSGRRISVRSKSNFSNAIFRTFRNTLRARPSIHDGRREPHVCLPHQARQPDHGRTDMKANTSPSPFESSMHAAVSTTRLRWVLSKRYATRVLLQHAHF